MQTLSPHRKNPQIYSIAADQPFADTLVDGLLARFGQGDISQDDQQQDFSLSDLTVLLPNRRAVRSVRDAFLKQAGGRPMLLPSLRAIGDVDEEAIEFLGADLQFGVASIPPTISKKKRQSLLMRQVDRWMQLNRPNQLAPAQSWRLAGDLMRLMDQVETEGLSFDGLKDLVAEDFASHWQITLDFLTIVTSHWPQILDAMGQINPAARRDRLMRGLVDAWAQVPPTTPVIIAGSSGTIPAARLLMKQVLALPQGMVILPGLDLYMSDTAWDSLRHHPSHPQHIMHKLLSDLHLTRDDVRDWDNRQGNDYIQSPNPSLRTQLMADAFLPSDAMTEWREMDWASKEDQTAMALDGCDFIVAPTRRDEATVIALIMREVLETPAKTAALVTPDRLLASHVKAILKRWHIAVDDSAGDPATITQTGAFLKLLADVFASDFAPLPLLSLLQHPYTAMGLARHECRQFVRALDQHVLRGPRPAGGIDGLTNYARQCLNDERNLFSKTDYTTLEQILSLFSPMDQAFKDGQPFSDLVRCFIQVAEQVASTSDTTGSDIVWRGDAGEALAVCLADMMADCDDLGPVNASEFAPLLHEMLKGETIRPKYGRHPRLAIWGTMEARLQRCDVMILSGLNEGTWPVDTGADPWMSREMRLSFGLPALERKIGQMAHDFMQAVAAPKVFITRAEKVDGSPTVPSRWLLRLEALIGGLTVNTSPYLAWAQGLDQADHYTPAKAPEPRPPLAARPRTLSVTQVESWMRDPFTLYASKILGLEKLDAVDARPSAAQKGTLIHAALERFLTEKGAMSGRLGVERLLDIGRDVFSELLLMPAVYAFWWPRFEQIAAWFVAWQESRIDSHQVALVERRGEAKLVDLDFTIKAFADRIDVISDRGQFEIIDYKTGKPPSSRRVLAGYAPQLPLEGWIIQNGGFPDLKKNNPQGYQGGEIAALTYIHLKGGLDVAKVENPVKDVTGTIMQAEEGLRHLIKTFDNVDTPYLASPRADITGYGDFDHLARLREWQDGRTPEQAGGATSTTGGQDHG